MAPWESADGSAEERRLSKTYRALLVGTGGIGDAHVRAVEATAGRVTLEAAVDIDPSRARDFCARHGIPSAFGDFAEALAQVKPDLVLIAAPPSLHASMCIAAMEAGAWVLCEKPLCASLAELDRIQAAESRTGRFTACVFQMRFASSHRHVRRLLRDGVLGRPLVAVCNTLWYRDAAYYAVPWRGRWATELGGPTTSQGIHTMDHLLHLLGDWEEIRAVAATLFHQIEVEDVSMALVKFANGARASIVNATVCPRQETYLRLDCERATVELTHLYAYQRENWRFTPAPPADPGADPGLGGLSPGRRLDARGPAPGAGAEHGRGRPPAHHGRRRGEAHDRVSDRPVQVGLHRRRRDPRFDPARRPVLRRPSRRDGAAAPEALGRRACVLPRLTPSSAAN